MTTSVSYRGYGILKASLSEHELMKLREKLTVKVFSTMQMGGDEQSQKTFSVYQESHKKIYIPKYYGLQKFGVPAEDKLSKGQMITLKFNGSLREEQQAPVQAFLNSIQDPVKRGGIINLVCAGGKTVCALYIISQISLKTLIIVHKDFLLDQWKERISQFLPDARVGIFKAAKCDIENKDIIIGSLQSLSMKDYDANRLFGDIGFIVVDEIHRTGAEVFSRFYKKINVRFSLGLSATIQRKDGLSKVFKWHIGDIVYKGEKRKDTIKVYMKEFFDSSHLYSREHLLFNKKPNISKMINNICEFPLRVNFIIECLKHVLSIEPERKVLILSDRRGHLESLKSILDSLNMDSGFYYGGLKQEELKANEKCQVLLATFAFSSEGLDIPKLDTLILASPKSDVIQSVGRILREKEKDRKHTPIVIDIIDKFSIFPNQANKRIKYYESQEYIIEWDKLFDDTQFKKLKLLEGHCLIREEQE